VFTATDADDANKAKLRDLFNQAAAGVQNPACGCVSRTKQCEAAQVQLHFFAASGVSSMEAALIEQIVASRSQYFVGTAKSTFSLEVQYERRVRNQWSLTEWRSMGGAMAGTGAGPAQVVPLCDSRPAGRRRTTAGRCEAW
jgi:hypothetical protein